MLTSPCARFYVHAFDKGIHFGIGTEEVIRVGGPCHVSHEI
jgi:hypothetical protein